ncbi:MAG TPA: DUF4159 domain-containing protein [Pirellulales bacterium]|nr:DUF4159 domain-containing protein [Pirellulales bacterium]
MRWVFSILVLVVPLVAIVRQPPPAFAAEEPGITAEEVRKAIDRGVQFLKKLQDPQKGTWSDQPNYGGGATPLCTLALLNCGYGTDDETVRKALAYLRTFQPTTTYACALETMVFCAAEPKRDLHLIGRNAKWLEEQQIREGTRSGMWSYPKPGAPNVGDNSNAQFALLGLYEAERAGVPVNDRVWKLAFNHWQKSQNPDGSWGYEPGFPGSGSMTSAGIASMIITSGELNPGDATVRGDTVACCGSQQPNHAVDEGLGWLDRNFSVYRNPPNSTQWLFYYLYGIERTGRMTARRFIGQHDWYREGAKMLIHEQLVTGAWPGQMFESDPVIATSFSLLFLAKGRRPVIVAHLKHGPENDWNRHRGALFNLVSHVEQSWHRDLTYQVIDPRVATVEDLLETPMLFINGRDAPQFSDQEIERLRMYVDRGGFLLAEQCCGTGDFDRGFRQLMNRMFPESDMKLRPLPADHPAWHADEKVDPSFFKEPLWGIDVGCRTSVIYSPQDLSCYWELARTGREKQYSPAVRQQIEAALGVGTNILAYATNREVKFKLEGLPTPASDYPDPVERGKLYVASIQHSGGCNAAPGALATLMRLAGEKLDVRAADRTDEIRQVRLSDPELFQYHLVFMHGRAGFRLSENERKELRVYLERGGTLFADAICSSPQFTEAFRREMNLVFPEQTLARIPVNHPLFRPGFGGDDVTTVSRRQPEASQDNQPLKSAVRKVEPYLEGIQLGDRYAVIFSPYDVSCALESHESLECEGYVRADAARLGLNVLLYSLRQ